MFENKSIKFKLLAWGIGSILIVSTILIYNSSSRLFASLHQNVKETSKGQAERSANQITRKLNESFSIARNLGHAFKAAKKSKGKLKFTREEADQLQMQVLRENPSLLGVWTLWEPNAFDNKDKEFKNSKTSDTTGRYIPYWTMSSNKIPQVEALVDYQNSGAGDYYQLAKKLHTEVILEPYMYKVGGVDTLITSLVYPIMINGVFVGVTGVDITLEFFQKLVGKINIYEGKGKVFVFSNSGIVAAYSADKNIINKKQDEIEINNYSKVVPARFNNKGSIEIDDFNVSTIIPLNIGRSEMPWYIETLVPSAVINSEIQSNILNLIGWGVFVSLILTGFGFVFINKMSSILGKIAEDLSIEAANVLGAANDIGTSSANLSSATHQQSTSLQETSASVNEIASMVKVSSSTAERTTVLSKDSQSKAERGRVSVNNVIIKIDEIHKNNINLVKRVEENNVQVENIITIIEEIADKTKVINDIVFQTKLLSFNASVEAARAGEQGKGFSVVAEEVGALAEMSGKASKEISDLLEKNSTQVRETVQSSKDGMNLIIKEGNTKVEEGLVEIKICNTVLEEIVSSFHDVNTAVEEIATSSGEQSTGVGEINEAISQLNLVTQQNTNIAQESSQKANELKSQSSKLVDIVDQIQYVIFGKGA